MDNLICDKKNAMKSFFNFLKRNKLYCAINIIGFSISIAFVMLLGIYVSRQLSTDSFQKNGDRIYAVGGGPHLSSAYYMPRYLKQKFPEIERSASYSEGGSKEYSLNGQTIYATTAYADSSFFDMFSFRISEADKEAWKSGEDKILLSESFAKANFPGADPLGQVFLRYGRELTVAGTYKDIENSVIKPTDIIVRGEQMEKENRSNNSSMNNAASSICFVMTYPGTDLRSRTDDILEYYKEIFWPYRNAGIWDSVEVVPLKDIYFHSSGLSDPTGSLLRGDLSIVEILLTMCLLLLLFSVLNYVNMTTALSGFRAKEMATRRLVGASKGEIFRTSMLESLVICGASTIVAALLAQTISPAMSRLLEYNISIFNSLSPETIGVCLIFTAIVSIISGLVPSLMTRRVKPIEIVRGTLKLKTKTLYSKVIIVVQCILSVVMLTVALTMQLQIKHLIDAPLGYDISDQLVIDNAFGNADALKPLVDKLQSDPSVNAVGLGDGHPLSFTNNQTMELENGDWISFQMIKGDKAYFEILGLREKLDNHLADAWSFNEEALREAGLDDDAKAIYVKDREPMAIGGIWYDFRIGNILNAQKPAMLKRFDDGYSGKDWPWTIVIKTVGSHKTAMERARAICSEMFPDKLFDVDWAEDILKEHFAKERQVSSIMLLFSILSIFISALGLVAMSSYYMQQERKTVSLKKVFGASYKKVLIQLVLSFIKLVGVAFVLAVPIGWILMNRWLQNYSYHISLYWWIFALAGLATAIIAGVSVLWQSIRTARTNPATELKKE